METTSAGAVDWRNWTYLARGNARQQRAFRALQALGIFDILCAYSPVLTGTIPLGVDTPRSDFGIISDARDLDAHERVVRDAFGARDYFQIERMKVKGIATVFARFTFEGLTIQVFAQSKPVTEQNAYRHMVVEARLLELGGGIARRAIRQLKNAGLETEPAFTRYFKIKGDPYEVLLELSFLNNAELSKAIAK
jgi:hypothetical protein